VAHALTPLDQSSRDWKSAQRFVSFALALALLIAGFARYGFGLHPEWVRFLDGAQNFPAIYESTLLTVGDRALLSNASLSWLAGLLDATTEPRFIAVGLIVTVVAVTCPFLLRMRSADTRFAQLAFLAIVGGPLLHVLLMWVGGYDAVLTIGLTVGALARNRFLVFSGWFVAALTHSAVTIPALMLWIVFTVVVQKTDSPSPWGWKILRTPVIAVASGWLMIRTLTDAWGGSTDRFALFQSIPYDGILQAYFLSFPLMVFSGLGAAWVLVFLSPLRQLVVTKWFIALSVFATLSLPLIAVDQTRIVALCMVPITMVWIDSTWPHLTQGDLTRLWKRFAWFGVLVPVPVVWMGTAYFTSWPIGW